MSTGQPHISYSSLMDFLKCGKLWQLKRQLGLPERPAMWNIGGHAVHSAIEAYEREVARGSAPGSR